MSPQIAAGKPVNQHINEVRAVVRAVDGDFAWVEPEQGGCGRCHEEGGCGGQHLTQLFCSGAKRYRVRNDAGAQAGDKVLIALPAGAVRRLANLAYVLPVFGLIGGAAFGLNLAGDSGAMIGGFGGLALAWAGVRLFSAMRSGNRDWQPHIVSLR